MMEVAGRTAGTKRRFKTRSTEQDDDEIEKRSSSKGVESRNQKRQRRGSVPEEVENGEHNGISEEDERDSRQKKIKQKKNPHKRGMKDRHEDDEDQESEHMGNKEEGEEVDKEKEGEDCTDARKKKRKRTEIETKQEDEENEEEQKQVKEEREEEEGEEKGNEEKSQLVEEHKDEDGGGDSSSKDHSEDERVAGEGLESGHESKMPAALNSPEDVVDDSTVADEDTTEQGTKPRGKGKRAVNTLLQPKRVLRPLASRLSNPSVDNPYRRNPGDDEEQGAETVGPILYRPGKEFVGLADHIGKSLVVHILAKYLTTKNQQVLDRNLWGSNYYTGDSDVVLMIAHTGFFELKETLPAVFGVGVTLRILEGKSQYPASKRFSVTSRKWPDPHYVSLQVKEVQTFVEKPSTWAKMTQIPSTTATKPKEQMAKKQGGRGGKVAAAAKGKQVEKEKENGKGRNGERKLKMKEEEEYLAMIVELEERQEQERKKKKDRERELREELATRRNQMQVQTLKTLALRSIEQTNTLKRKAVPTTKAPARKGALLKKLKMTPTIAATSFEIDRWAPLPESPMHFSLSNEPCFKYTLRMIADKGLESKHWTSTRLQTFGLYLETDSARYELVSLGSGSTEEHNEIRKGVKEERMGVGEDRLDPTEKLEPGDHSTEHVARSENTKTRYRWSEVLLPCMLDKQEMQREGGAPLPPERVRVLADELLWTEIHWCENSVSIRGVVYPVRSFFWLRRKGR